MFALSSAIAAATVPSADEWVSWKAKHHKVYPNAEVEQVALKKWSDNFAEVQKANMPESGIDWQLELNEFADLSPDEFKGRYNGYVARGHVRGKNEQHKVSSKALPTEVDWRSKGLVTDVKNQGSCGSCWAFSTVVSIEGQQAKKTGKLVSLSEQNLVDCVKNEKLANQTDTCCNGCQGGLMDFAFQYMIDHQGGQIDTEAAYGYKGFGGRCAYDKSDAGATITKYVDIPVGDETALMDAVANVGPVSVGVDASLAWQLYFGGVLKTLDGLLCSSNPSKMDHGVAVVGYGTDNGVDYWIVKNSWGSSWGEKGYVRLIRGKNACGIANSASYPVVA